jgi:hypothetical protein
LTAMVWLRRSGPAWNRCRIGDAGGKTIPTKLGHLREPIIRKEQTQPGLSAGADCGWSLPTVNSGEHARGKLVGPRLISAGLPQLAVVGRLGPSAAANSALAV